MTLYKYVVADRIDIIKNGLIRFSQPSALNDPWEMSPHIEQLMSEHDMEQHIVNPVRERPQEELVEQFTDILHNVLKTYNLSDLSHEELKQRITEADAQFPGELRALFDSTLSEAFGIMKQALPLAIEQVPSAIDKALGILSLTEKPDHPLMWSHYANNHSGLVIAFDETHEFFTARRSEPDEIGGLHKINYTIERPTFDVLVEPNLEEPRVWMEKLFFTKSREWEYEQEWRMVKSLKDATKVIENTEGNIHLYSLPPTCITGIILGQKMTANARSEIIEFVGNDNRYSHAAISEALSSGRDYKIEIVPIELRYQSGNA